MAGYSAEYERHERLRQQTDTLLESIEEEIQIEGKLAKTALAEQPVLLAKWKRLYASCYGLTADLEQKLEETYASAYYDLQINSKRQWNSTEAGRLTLGNKEYKEIRSLYNRCKEMLKEVDGAISVIESRGYSLKSYLDLAKAGYDRMLL